MNAVEIEEAVSALVEAPFDADEFPYQFLAAFGNKATTIKRLRTGSTNKSDVAGGVLQRNNIHIAVCDEGTVEATLPALRDSAGTTSQKAKYILATDGKTVEAESMEDGETLACEYEELADHFGFFLTLAGITTVKQIRDNAFDIKATSRLNKLYVELLKENPEWEERREELNHFFARLIFCFFAEDTNIFQSDDQFTGAIEKMAASDSSNTHEVIAELFRSMNTKQDDREAEKIKRWASEFPYVNGGLFSGSLDVPRFSKIARSYLIHIGHLDWTKINPDIFGSMIQAVAEDEERGELGMHYTSVPNILKVLNPLFLDDLREKLEEAGDGSDQGSKRKLLNLRNRMARIRVFDPACGSGNFLVIAYKEMRAIEAQVNERRGESERRSDLPLTNFRGIELRHFASEIARLALIIAEYQCDVLYRGPTLALAEVLPLEASNWITHGNALRIDWLSVCPPTGTGVKYASDDLYSTPLDQPEIDFENEGGVTFICGNPPYKGSQGQTQSQKSDMASVFEGLTKKWRSLDYVAGWFVKAAAYSRQTDASIAFVATNSICQGRQVQTLWPLLLDSGLEISFAHTSFKWSNLASDRAGVTVVIVGLATSPSRLRPLFQSSDEGSSAHLVENINPYLAARPNLIVTESRQLLSDVPPMLFGSMANDKGALLMSASEAREAVARFGVPNRFIRQFVGTEELVDGKIRKCVWMPGPIREDEPRNDWLTERFRIVESARGESTRATTQQLATVPHRFGEVRQRGDEQTLIVAGASSETREYLPCDYLAAGTITSNLAFAIFDAPVWALSIVASRMHLAWVAAVCGQLETRYRYSNTLGWNTFPLPSLTEQNRVDLSVCARRILLARESYWPASLADMYDPENMDAEYPNLREAHDRNDEVMERIYIGRRFRNDTERLEKLFEMYIKMTGAVSSKQSTKGAEA